MLELDAGLGEPLDALLEELEGQPGLVLGQGLRDALDEDGVVGGDAHAVRF